MPAALIVDPSNLSIPLCVQAWFRPPSLLFVYNSAPRTYVNVRVHTARKGDILLIHLCWLYQ